MARPLQPLRFARPPRRIPRDSPPQDPGPPLPDLRATYRLQLGPDLDLRDAAGLIPYLVRLGVSHLYLSPVLQAVPGSSHGYDVVDPTRVSDELGGAEALEALAEAAREAGLGLVLDIVPNHMAIGGPENRWWWDVLANGPFSPWAPFFDIDWETPEERLRGQILLPVLGDHYGRALEGGELELVRDGPEPRVRYHDRIFPLSPASTGDLLDRAAAETGSDRAGFLAGALTRLPTGLDPATRARRGRDYAVLRDEVAGLLEGDESVADALDRHLAGVSRDPDLLDALLEAQHYRLAYWRSATRDLSYRRFFDIDGLAALRVEDERVFRETHGTVLDGLRRGMLDGLRVDHVDGLRRPAEYLGRLRREAPDAWIVVEKILEPGEELPASWPVDGTTGYDFLGDTTALFVDPAGEEPLTALYREATGEATDWEAIAYARRHQVLRDVLAADLERLAHLFLEICEGRRRFRDFDRHEVRESLREVLACFRVYRAYVGEQSGGEEAAGPTEQDRRVVEEAVERAGARRPDLDGEILGFLQAILLAEAAGPAETDLRMRFQQLSGPVMAKAVEDTSFYVFNRMVALNEVGGDPSRFGLPVRDWHAGRRADLERRPRTMTALSTHDTKRSEDVRARLALLAEIPARWGEAVRRWREWNARHRTAPGLPDANAEYLLYQTLVGAWPIPAGRVRAYMEKAAREAKTHTSWRRPVEAYDEALAAFVDAVLADDDFLADLEAFVGPLVGPGRINGLAMKLLQLTAPGVPDVYRGTELWDLSLVDPDNRRPVDFGRRDALLAGLREGGVGWESVRHRSDEGLTKLLVVERALDARRRRPAALGPEGSYDVLEAEGPAADHVVAFVRGGEVVTAVPRLILRLARSGGWRGTSVALPPGRWRDAFTGGTLEGRVPLTDLLGRCPVALLEREGPSDSTAEGDAS